MKRNLKIIILILVIASCSQAVLDRQLADRALLSVPFAAMPEYPLLYRGDLYLLGGLIVDAKQTEQGLVLEALYMPVNRRGYIRDDAAVQGTYLALLPGNGPGIDELTYRPGTYISVAAEFIGLEAGIKSTGKYPLFSVRDVHAWGEKYPKAARVPPDDPSERPPVDPAPFGQKPVLPPATGQP